MCLELNLQIGAFVISRMTLTCLCIWSFYDKFSVSILGTFIDENGVPVKSNEHGLDEGWRPLLLGGHGFCI